MRYHIFTHQDSHLQTQYYPNLVLSLPLVGTLTAKGPLLLKLCNCYYISHITFLFFCFFLHHLRTFFGELMSFCQLNIRISPSGEGKTKQKTRRYPRTFFTDQPDEWSCFLPSSNIPTCTQIINPFLSLKRHTQRSGRLVSKE